MGQLSLVGQPYKTELLIQAEAAAAVVVQEKQQQAVQA
jgi:hypothetical protein